MNRWTIGASLVILGGSLSVALAAPPETVARKDLLLYSSFDKDIRPEVCSKATAATFEEMYVPGGKPAKFALIAGKVGSCLGQAVTYDAYGSYCAERGTIAFWYQVGFEPQVLDTWGEQFFLTGGSPTEGYWGDVLQLGWALRGPYFRMFDAGKVAQGGFTDRLGKWKKGDWHHVAFAWDQLHGVRCYDDGKEFFSTWDKEPWQANMLVDRLELRPGTDEFYVFSEALSSNEIALLMENKALPARPDLDAERAQRKADRRGEILKNRGWEKADEAGMLHASLGTAPQDDGPAFKQIAFGDVTDQKRPSRQVCDGVPQSTWPHMCYVTLISGQKLLLPFGGRFTEEGPSGGNAEDFDHVNITLVRPFAGRLYSVDEEQRRRDVLTIRESDGMNVRAALPDRRHAMQLVLERQTGMLDEIRVYRTEENAGKLGLDARKGVVYYLAGRLDPQAFNAEPPWMILTGENAPEDQMPVEATVQGPKEESTIPVGALSQFQIVTGKNDQPYGLRAVHLSLAFQMEAAENVFNVIVCDPIYPLRRAFEADLHVVKSDPRSKVAVLNATLDFPDRWVTEGRRIVVRVTTREPIALRLGGEAGSRIRLMTGSFDEVIPEHREDQLHYLREAFADMNEGIPWRHGVRRWVWRSHLPATDLIKVLPEDPVVRYFAGEVRAADVKAEWVNLPVPEGYPEWAVYQRALLEKALSVIHWTVDHQAENGEFGGEINDDTDMLDDWPDLVMISDDDHKILNAMKRLANCIWNSDVLENGQTRYPIDNLHAYEQGVGMPVAQLVIDYGNPIHIERAMLSASHLLNWTAKTPEGYRFFRGWTMSGTEILTEGRYNGDKRYFWAAPMMFPALNVAWYNGNPTCIQIPYEWCRSYNGLFEKSGQATPKDTRKFPKAVYMNPLRVEEGETVRQQATGAFFTVCHGAWKLTGEKDPLLLAFTKACAGWTNYNREGPGKAAVDYFKATGDTEYDAALLPIIKKWLDNLKPAGAGTTAQFFQFPSEWAYYYWYKTGDKTALVKDLRRCLTYLTNAYPYFTWAYASTDRKPLPKMGLERMYIGNHIMNRAGDCGSYPDHALSYEGLGTSVAALLHRHNRQGFKLVLFNFDDQPRPIKLRVWDLDHGEYELLQGADKNQDDQFDADPVRSAVTLARGDRIPLTLPSRVQYVVELKQTKLLPDIKDRPDLAISAETITLNWAEGHLIATVHNIGARPAKNIRVRFLNDHGRMIGEEIIAQLDAPLDLKPRMKSVSCTNGIAFSSTGIWVVVDPDNEIEEITKDNNKVFFKFQVPAP